ncbi:MAG: hypothetical protein JOY54_19315 [Acidobacteriaceae bacterium]|nr:hypothetical protein [Acidobacteriaceae bacterium]
MYLFEIFRSFLPMRNPIGFGASDFVVLVVALLLVALLVARAWVAPYTSEIAKRTFPCMGVLFGLPILLRLALLPHCPVPIAAGADDFGYVLLGDTLRHFRLANPTHPLYPFFEAVFILQQPTYASIYPLGQGIVLALGWFISHSFWTGVLLSVGAFCALCYWMLRAWVAPGWALLGGLLAVIEFGVLNEWVNSYWGGAVSACAGCLVFGSLPRLWRSAQARHGLLLGLGLALQLLTRPFETVLLAICVAVYVFFAFRTKLMFVARPALAGSVAVLAALGLMLLQNKAVTQNWTTLPYMLSRYQYGVPTTFTFQPNPVPHRQLTAEQDLDYRAQAAIHGSDTDTVAGYFNRLAYRFRYLRFFLLPPLYLALLAVLPSLRDWRYLWAAGTIGLFAIGTNFYPFFFPHYVAAVTCLFVLLAVRGLENLSRLNFLRWQGGEAAAQYVLLLCGVSFMFWFGLYASGNDRLLPVTTYQRWNFINRGDPEGRIAVHNQLAHVPGKQLVFVRYSPFHRFHEWIHNAADIDAAQIVWANDLGPEENEKLLRYFAGRKPWLLEPDAHPPALRPYETGSGEFLTVH